MQGVWVVYLTLAALPLFGIGGVLVREADLENRRILFQLLCLYLASGLGLLSVVRLLGLRRYLRERQVEMPRKMVAVWVTGSVVLIAGLLVTAALLPRRNSEYGVLNLLSSPERVRSSRWSVGHDGAKQSDPRHIPNAVASVPYSPVEIGPDGRPYLDNSPADYTQSVQQFHYDPRAARRVLRYSPGYGDRIIVVGKAGITNGSGIGVGDGSGIGFGDGSGGSSGSCSGGGGGGGGGWWRRRWSSR